MSRHRDVSPQDLRAARSSARSRAGGLRRDVRAVTRAAALAGAAFAAASAPAGEDPPRAPGTAAPRHPVVLWTFDDDAARPGFADAVRSLGAGAIQCPPDRDPAPFRAAGLGWYEDHSAGKGVLALRDREWRPAWDRAWEERREEWPSAVARSRPVCVGSGESWLKMVEKVRGPAARAADGALWISLEDEPGIVARANPGDWCLCDSCVAAFRGDLRDRFGGRIALLNERWGTTYASWDDVRPWTTAAIRKREFGKGQDRWNLAPWMDTREFQDRKFAHAVAVVARAADVASKGTPTGLSGLQAPSAFGGFDLSTLTGGLSYAEPYDIGLALPVVRDVAAPRVLAQTVFPDGADGRTSRWKLWRGIARGANATIVWSSHDALRWDAAKGAHERTDWGRAVSADFARLTAPGGLGERLAATAPLREGVVVLLSQPSIRVRWMLDSIPDGDTWMRRFGSHEARHSTAIRSREEAWRALARRGVRFVDSAVFAREMGSGPAPRVVVLPDAIALGDDIVRRLDALAVKGTVVVADTEPARFDETGRARKPGVPGAVTDAGFARLEERVERAAGPPVLRATAVRADGGLPPPIEIGLRTAPDGIVWAVCVPMWDVTSADDGSTTGSIPRTNLTVTFRLGSGAARDVRDEWSGTPAGRVTTWTWTGDAAAPAVFSIGP